jgi:ubiquinone/menaquinone biosynthesis C-methylase UbiE
MKRNMLTSASIIEPCILGTEEAGIKRLRVLREMCGASTAALLDRVGLRPGMRVADIGCGIGIATRQIAKKIGPRSLVTGIDANEKQVIVARREAANARIGNAEFATASAYNTKLKRATFDMVYCRFLLPDVQRPLDVLRHFAALLRPGGMLVCEDIEADTLTTVPQTAAYLNEREQILALSSKRGLDYNIGPKLPGYLRQIGCVDIDTSLAQWAYFRGERKRFWEYTLMEAAHAAIEDGLISKQQVEERVEAMRAVNEDEGVLLIMPRVWQVWGRKAIA